LNANRSSFPFMLNLLSPAPTSMWALAVLKKGLQGWVTLLSLVTCLVPRSLLAQRNLLSLSECFQQFPQGCEMIDRPIVCTLCWL
jgi:hypothetical protein